MEPMWRGNTEIKLETLKEYFSMLNSRAAQED